MVVLFVVCLVVAACKSLAYELSPDTSLGDAAVSSQLQTSRFIFFCQHNNFFTWTWFPRLTQ